MLRTAADPVGDLNDASILALAREASGIVVAWGGWPGPDAERPAAVIELLRADGCWPVFALGVTASGAPRHPSRMPNAINLVKWPAPTREAIADVLNLLPFVHWDRCTGTIGGAFVAYGWIARADRRADFIVLEFDGDDVGFTTSSATRSVEIATLLHGHADSHQPCRRVSDELGDLVTRKAP